MAFLVVAGVTVPVALNTTQGAPVEAGERVRAWDNSMLATIRDRKKEWQVTTRPIPRADANTLEAALNGTPPLACSGDLLGGAVNCHAQITDLRYAKYAPGEHVVLVFTLMEA